MRGMRVVAVGRKGESKGCVHRVFNVVVGLAEGWKRKGSIEDEEEAHLRTVEGAVDAGAGKKGVMLDRLRK